MRKTIVRGIPAMARRLSREGLPRQCSLDASSRQVIASRIMDAPVSDTRSSDLVYAVLACLFAALISIGSYIAIPIPGTPVPIVLQNFFIMIAALILGPWWGLLSVGLYLLFGIVGLPVFSGGSGGLAKLAGPTGGYLLGYIPAIIVMGLLSRAKKAAGFRTAAALVLGMAIVYLAGVWRLKMVIDASWARAFATGALPFLPGDIAKIVLASLLAPRLRTALRNLLAEEL